MTVEVVPATSAGLDVDTWARTLEFSIRMAEYVNRTEFVPTALRGRPEAVAATIMYGAEVGLTPMQALAGIHIVEGRPSPSSETMRALILRAGHSITVHEATGTRVRVSGLRAGQPESARYTVEWTTDMARSAGLLGRKNWQNYPRAMLMARATGDLARVLFADVVKGLGYVAEDVDADAAWGPPEVDTIGQDKPRKAIQRTRRPRVATPDGLRTTDAQEAPSEPRAHDGTQPPVAPAASPEPTPREAVSDTNDEQPERSRLRTVEDVPLPEELEPEQPPPEPPAGPKTIAPSPLKALHTALGKELGTVATREEKLSMVGAILDKVVTSTKDLTRAEGYEVLDVLARIADGSVTYDMDPETGHIVVHRPDVQ